MAQDVRSVKKRKKVDLHDVQVTERIKLAWEVRRQVLQEILQEKLSAMFPKVTQRTQMYSTIP
jgi:hypothetical protein